MDSPTDAWKQLETMHEGNRLSKIIKMVLDIFTTPVKGDEKIFNYLAKIKNIKDQLDGCNCELF